MSTPDFSTAENTRELAQEVTCLKTLLTLMLPGYGPGRCGPRYPENGKADRSTGRPSSG